VGQTSYEVNRPRFWGVAISAASGKAYALPDIETLTTSKKDDGSAGTFSITMPLIQPYTPQGQAQYPRILAYAAVAGPMDLVAIFAYRTFTGNQSSQVDAQPSQQDPFSAIETLVGLAYGESGAATVTRLGVSSCLMIGMLDGARSQMSFTGSRASFSMNGRDLTKIFEVNDATIPDAALAAQAGAGQGQNAPGFFGLGSLQLSQANSGPTFLVSALDLLVAKDLNALKTVGTASAAAAAISPAAKASYLSFGYPWRNFIRTDALDFSYLPLTSQNYPPYTPQMGAIWASLLEIRNPPLSRMFVNEIGQLIYDDSFKAWTANDIAGIIGGEDIRDFDSGFDDGNLITFLSCMPKRLVASAEDVAAIKGGFLPGTGFVNGIAAASNAKAAQVAIYGYRYGQFMSQFDITYADALKRQAYLLQVHNNIFSATISVRGNSIYRVGQRYQINYDTNRPETTNAVWYVEGVQHHCETSPEWVTTLSLRFPQNTNFGSNYYPS
jgi:hypothetical protein